MRSVKIGWIMFVAHAQSHLVCNVFQKLSKDYINWFLQKGTDIIMLITCWLDKLLIVKTLFTNHFKWFSVLFPSSVSWPLLSSYFEVTAFSPLKITFKGLTDLGQLNGIGILVVCIVFSKTARNWFLGFWFPKSIAKKKWTRYMKWAFS